MKKVLVVAETIELARRKRRVKPNENITYLSFKNYNEELNDDFDEIILDESNGI